MSERTCGRCGDTYESYTVFVTDDFESLSNYHEIEEKYGNVCEPCREEIS